MKSLVLIACGSFNPVNYMHLRMFEIAKDYFLKKNVEKIIGFISPVNDQYPKKGLIKSSKRILMLELALNTSDWIKLDVWESTQKKWTKTFDVLNYFQQLVIKMDKENSFRSNIILLAGADLFHSFTIPGLWDINHIIGIVRDFGLAIISRTGTEIELIFEALPYIQPYKENIFIIPDPIPNEISSTRIRLAISQNESVKYLLPDTIIEYIQVNHLYKD